jgi:hypothetical protein
MGDLPHEIVCDAQALEDSWFANRNRSRLARRRFASGGGVVGCSYYFTSTNGLPPREDRVDLVFAGETT